MMYLFEPVSLPDMVLLLQGIRQTHDNHFLLHRQNIQSEFSSFHPDVLIRLRCNLCSWRKTWSEVQRHKGHVGSIIPEQSSERASSEEACAVLLIHGDAVHLRLLKCRSPQGLKFCISSSFQKMSVASLNGLTSRSRCVRKGQVVNSSSGVMRSTECHIQGVQTVWIWTGYLISCRLFSSAWDKKEWGLLHWTVLQNNSVHTCETLWNIPGTYEALNESVSFYNKAKDDDNDTFSAVFFFEQRTVVATWAKRCYQQVLENTGNIASYAWSSPATLP